jgi:hypothetical protein
MELQEPPARVAIKPCPPVELSVYPPTAVHEPVAGHTTELSLESILADPGTGAAVAVKAGLAQPEHWRK